MDNEQQMNIPANVDIKDASNLLNSSDNVQDLVDKAQILTETTSVARQAFKLGEETPKMTSEEILNRAVASYHRNITILANLIKAKQGSSYVISRKGMSRVLSAIVQMPTEGLPISLQGEDEKAAFHLGQKVLLDRYIITHNHVVEEQKKLKAQQEANKTNTVTEKTKGEA